MSFEEDCERIRIRVEGTITGLTVKHPDMPLRNDRAGHQLVMQALRPALETELNGLHYRFFAGPGPGGRIIYGFEAPLDQLMIKGRIHQLEVDGKYPLLLPGINLVSRCWVLELDPPMNHGVSVTWLEAQAKGSELEPKYGEGLDHRPPGEHIRQTLVFELYEALDGTLVTDALLKRLDQILADHNWMMLLNNLVDNDFNKFYFFALARIHHSADLLEQGQNRQARDKINELLTVLQDEIDQPGSSSL